MAGEEDDRHRRRKTGTRLKRGHAFPLSCDGGSLYFMVLRMKIFPRATISLYLVSLAFPIQEIQTQKRKRLRKTHKINHYILVPEASSTSLPRHQLFHLWQSKTTAGPQRWGRAGEEVVRWVMSLSR
jgi:hypothetical protein